jgi:2-C-methyl-D-erythritol 4-phosphate cytidylyltransferase
VDGVWGIVVAAGRGDRFGKPKQFCDLAGRRVVDYSLSTMTAVCDAVVLVLPADVTGDGEPVAAVVQGGATRSESVRAGLRAVPDVAEVVVIQDAARPLASRALFDAVIAAVRAGADAAVPAIPVADTLKRVAGDRVTGTVDRAQLVAVQTPQAFRASVLRAAHASADEATDDAALVEAVGGRVVVVSGDPRNRKITDPADLEIAEALLRSAAHP